MSIPSGPDVEWVRRLIVGDVVALAFANGVLQPVGPYAIKCVTPTGIIRLAGRTITFGLDGWSRGEWPMGPRYLVKPEDSKP